MFDLRCLLSFFISPHTPARVDKKCSALNFFSVCTCSLLFALVWPCVHCFSKWVFITLFKVTFLIKLPTMRMWKKCHLAGRLNPRRSPQQRCGSINTSCAPKKRLQSRNNYPSCSSTLIFCRQVKHFDEMAHSAQIAHSCESLVRWQRNLTHFCILQIEYCVWVVKILIWNMRSWFCGLFFFGALESRVGEPQTYYKLCLSSIVCFCTWEQWNTICH
jgi:hypothetical protein